MAQGHGKRPDGKAVELPQERLARQKLEATLDTRTKEAHRALEKAQAGGEIDAEVAAQLQKGMGNAALAGMVKGGSETSTATTEAEATLDQAREKEGEEEHEEKEAGELEQVLPSFSSGGGGGGGNGGNSPWAVGKFFGGDGDGETDPALLGGPRWRPMPVPPDPDDEVEVEALDTELEQAERPPVSLAEADAALGSAPWAAGPLTRGLRHPDRLVNRRAMDENGLPDSIWARARAMVSFLARHAPDAAVHHTAVAARALGVSPDTPLVVAIARELAIVEACLARLPPGWGAACDVAADQRARARVEQTAAALASENRLFAPELLSMTLGEVSPAVEVALGREAHPAAEAAVEAAAHLAEMPTISSWEPAPESIAPTRSDVDRLLDAALGIIPDIPTLSASVVPLYRQLNRLLGALGAVQVEVASACVATWPWLPDGVAEGVATQLDKTLRVAARKLVEIGREVEQAVAENEAAPIEVLARRAAALGALVELSRSGAVRTLASGLLTTGRQPATVPQGEPELERMLLRGRSEQLRPLLEGRTDLYALSIGARLDGAPGVLARLRTVKPAPTANQVPSAGSKTTVREELPPLPAGTLPLNAPLWRVLVLAAAESAGDEASVPEEYPAQSPYLLAYSAILAARTQGAFPLLHAAEQMRAMGEGGALNLLKAAWTEFFPLSGTER